MDEKTDKQDKQTLISLLKCLLYARLVEERICGLYPEQQMRCPVHISIGQEAVAVGVCKNLERDDVVFSNHRCHAHYLAKGGDLKKFFAEIYGRADGCSKGRGGSMHLVDLNANFMGSTPIVGGTMPVAVGAALALSMKKEKTVQKQAVSVIFLGDGAAEEGVFHESLNFAKLKNLPVLFVCENNLYSVYTPLHLRQPKRKIMDIAAVHGLYSQEVDGNDVLAVYEASKKAVESMRNGNGPAFIEAFTYRWKEHCGPNCDTHLGYRLEEEVNEWKSMDPLTRLMKRMIDERLISDYEIREMEDKIKKDIDDAVEFAKSSPFPDKKELGWHIYAD